MGRNKNLRKRLKGIDRSISVHERKIQKELTRPFPNRERIEHWEAEIRNWKRERDYILRTLPQKE